MKNSEITLESLKNSISNLQRLIARQQGHIYGLHALCTSTVSTLTTSQRLAVKMIFENRVDQFSAMNLSADTVFADDWQEALEEFQSSVDSLLSKME